MLIIHAIKLAVFAVKTFLYVCSLFMCSFNENFSAIIALRVLDPFFFSFINVENFARASKSKTLFLANFPPDLTCVHQVFNDQTELRNTHQTTQTNCQTNIGGNQTDLGSRKGVPNLLGRAQCDRPNWGAHWGIRSKMCRLWVCSEYCPG